VLAHLPTAPVSRAAVKYYGDRFREHPIGTGAYTLRHRDHQKQQRIVLTANPDYRGRPDVDGFAAVDAAQRQPHIRRLQIDFFKADLPPWFLFRQGLLDISAIPKDTFSQAVRQGGELTAAMQRQGIKLVKAPDPTTYYIGFNMLDAVLGRNKPLRQAMSMAINRQRFISVYRNGRGELPIGPIPPGFESFDPQEANPYARFDPQAARDLLAKAQQIHGGPLPKLSLLMSGTDTEDRQMGDFLRSQWEAMGLRIEVDYTDWARFLDIVERRRTAQLFFLAWQADYPDEQNFFQLFYGKNIREGGQNNTAWKNEAFDRLYEQASVLPPGPPRTAVYKQMSRLVMDECPWALLYYPSSYVLHHGWVDNLLLSDYLHGARQHLKLDSSARSAWLSRNR
jgi:ABC-type transport system substrate-binding protein